MCRRICNCSRNNRPCTEMCKCGAIEDHCKNVAASQYILESGSDNDVLDPYDNKYLNKLKIMFRKFNF